MLNHSRPSRHRAWRSLLGFAAGVGLTAAAGHAFTMQGVDRMFHQIIRPAWSPPAAVFAPVWLVLYALMIVAGWLFWTATPNPQRQIGQQDRLRTAGLIFFCLQLCANATWSYLYFGQGMVGAALADIVVLWLCIAAFIAVCWQRSRTAAALFVPYALWVAFAAVLNAAIWRLNTA